MQPAKIPSYIFDQRDVRLRREKRRKNIIRVLKEIAFLAAVFIVFYAFLYAWGGK